VLDLQRLTAGYGAHTVLRDVTLRVPDGSVVALLGANGAGKTTLLRTASGLLRPSSGAMWFDGQDITNWSPHRMAEIGICHIPEGRGIFPSLTVRENLRIQCVRGSEYELVDKAVTVFPSLGRRIDHPAGKLSGGEQQMLALARAYVQQPKLALLDEVSMGLAPVIVDEIFEFIKMLASEGSSLLLVEQYVSRALEVADFVYLLNRGEVRFVGEPSELDGSDIFKEYVGVEIGA
jgi:branched-chain amino acid transport system ATP-binding protein